MTNALALKKLKKRIDTKLNLPWKKQVRSSLASDFIHEKLGVLFVLHNATRWNSFFDAVKCVAKLFDSKNEALRETFQHFNIAPLTLQEEEYIAEYVRIMEPFTLALDSLQNEKEMSLGCVLPTIKLLKDTLEELSLDATIIHSQPLILCVLQGLEKRFRPFFTNIHLKLASVSDPNFKTIWVEPEDFESIVSLLKSVIRRLKKRNTNRDVAADSSLGQG